MRGVKADCLYTQTPRRSGQHLDSTNHDWIMVAGPDDFLGRLFRLIDIRAGGWPDGTKFQHQKTKIVIEFNCSNCAKLSDFWACWNCKLKRDHHAIKSNGWNTDPV